MFRRVFTPDTTGIPGVWPFRKVNTGFNICQHNEVHIVERLGIAYTQNTFDKNVPFGAAVGVSETTGKQLPGTVIINMNNGSTLVQEETLSRRSAYVFEKKYIIVLILYYKASKFQRTSYPILYLTKKIQRKHN
jgi:hypothetical protein